MDTQYSIALLVLPQHILILQEILTVKKFVVMERIMEYINVMMAIQLVGMGAVNCALLKQDMFVLAEQRLLKILVLKFAETVII